MSCRKLTYLLWTFRGYVYWHREIQDAFQKTGYRLYYTTKALCCGFFWYRTVHKQRNCSWYRSVLALWNVVWEWLAFSLWNDKGSDLKRRKNFVCVCEILLVWTEVFTKETNVCRPFTPPKACVPRYTPAKNSWVPVVKHYRLSLRDQRDKN